jgi:hypothetical protein
MSSNSYQLLCSVQLHYINSRLYRILSQGDSHNPAPSREPPRTLAQPAPQTQHPTLCESTKLQLRGGQRNDITRREIRRVLQHFSLYANSEFRNAFKRHLLLKSFLQHSWTLVHVDVGYMRFTVENEK